MIYQTFFAGIPANGQVATGMFGGGDRVDAPAAIREMMEETHHSLVWIITTTQWDNFQSFLERNDLKQYVTYEMPYFVSNQNHGIGERRLKLVLMKGKKNEATLVGV